MDSYNYNSNRLIYSKHVMQNTNGNTTEHKEWSHNEYALAAGMPTKSWHKTDSDVFTGDDFLLSAIGHYKWSVDALLHFGKT